ncbi:MAG TPA: hypothetical protein VMM76_13440 [Pirellulaceae bacterium]|nr:hypothetical protein [Pirellulaceae bacterium]
MRTIDSVAFNVSCYFSEQYQRDDEGNVEEGFEETALDDVARCSLDSLVAMHGQTFREPKLVELNSDAIAYLDRKVESLGLSAISLALDSVARHLALRRCLKHACVGAC